jgi:hypothetical protein
MATHFYFYFLYIYIYIFIYDRNSNLNSHIHLYFEDPGNQTHALIEEWGFLGRGITTGPNAQVACGNS